MFMLKDTQMKSWLKKSQAIVYDALVTRMKERKRVGVDMEKTQNLWLLRFTQRIVKLFTEIKKQSKKSCYLHDLFVYNGFSPFNDEFEWVPDLNAIMCHLKVEHKRPKQAQGQTAD